MTGLVLRLSLAASWSKPARPKALLVTTAAAVVSVLASGCLSAWLLSDVTHARATERAFVPASASETASLERSALFDDTPDGDQIYVYWWRVNDTRATIPGVPRSPAVGSWFVSPALAGRIVQEPTLAIRYPNASVIRAEGVAHPDELLAYRFVGPDIRLDERLTVGPADDWIGDGTETIDTYPIAVAAAGLIGLPGVGLLAASFGALGPLLDRRLAVLNVLGAPNRIRLTTAAVHALASAVPGALVGAVLWWATAPALEGVPFMGRRVFKGDLAVPVTWSAAVVCFVACLAVAVAIIRTRVRATVRPTQVTHRVPGPTRVVPLAIALAVLLAGVVVPDRTGAKLFLAGIVATAAGTAIGLPWLMVRAGDRLAASPGSTLSLLVGRRIRATASTSVRSVLTLAVVAVLLPVAAAWVTVARSADRPAGDDPIEVIELIGQPDRESEVQRLLTRVPTLEIAVPVSDHAGTGVTLVGDCRRLSTDIEFARCDNDGFEIEQGTLGILAGLPGTDTVPPGYEVASTMIASPSGSDLEPHLRAAVLNGADSDLHIDTPGREPLHESPLVGWILGAAALAGVVGAIAVMLSVAGHASRLARTRHRLLAVGADSRLVRRLAATEAAVTVAAVGFASLAIGTACAWAFIQKNAAGTLPVDQLLLLTGGVLATSIVGGTAAAAAAAGHQR